MDNIIELMGQVEDAEIEIDELNECGDLESRLEAAEKLSDLEDKLFRARMIETGGL